MHSDFLEFAQSQLKSAKKEFDYRNAAGRAYYYVFHCCLEHKIGVPYNKDRGSHDNLYDAIGKLPDVEDPATKLLKNIAYVARMMKDVRNHADYKLKASFTEQDAKQQVKDAEKVRAKYRELCSL